jgi:hypothetical protein
MTPGAAVSHDSSAEQEILDRLDEILPGGGPTQASIATQAPQRGAVDTPEVKVVSFDPDRARKRRNEKVAPPATSPAAAGSSASAAHGGAGPALHKQKRGEPAPAAHARTEPREEARPHHLPEAAPTASRWWIWPLVLVMVLGVAGAVVYLLSLV